MYLKLREQILSFNNPESDLERTGGLNLINTTNLSYFDKTQKSELFRLKAIFLASLRRTSKSNQAYCHSVQICPTHAKSWISWGGLCSSLGTLTERQTEQMAKKSGSSEKSKVRVLNIAESMHWPGYQHKKSHLWFAGSKSRISKEGGSILSPGYGVLYGSGTNQF